MVVVLAAFGFYGIHQYIIRAGRRELAVRAALGGDPRSLGRLVLRRSLMTAVPGIVLGGFLAFVSVLWLLRDGIISRAVSPFVTMLAVSIGIGVVVVATSLGAVRQARSIRPSAQLRED